MATVKTSPKTPAKTVDARAEKFITLGQKRVGAAIHKIRLVRNLANRAAYNFNAEQVESINVALLAEIESLAAKFATALSAPAEKTAAKEPGFTF